VWRNPSRSRASSQELQFALCDKFALSRLNCRQDRQLARLGPGSAPARS
jgi:hypothetical protein